MIATAGLATGAGFASCCCRRSRWSASSGSCSCSGSRSRSRVALTAGFSALVLALGGSARGEGRRTGPALGGPARAA